MYSKNVSILSNDEETLINTQNIRNNQGNKDVQDIKRTSIYVWIAAIIVPIWIFFCILFYFRYIYLFLFSTYDPNFIIGFVIQEPVQYICAIFTFYIILPKYRFEFMIIICVFLGCINSTFFYNILVYSYDFGNSLRYIQSIISEVLIFIILLKAPKLAKNK